MLKLFFKLGTASGLLTTTFVTNFDKVENSNLMARDKSDSEEIKKEIPERMETIDDIKLFEKRYGCSFIFVKSWKKEHYRVDEFLEKEKTEGKDWKSEVLKGANHEDSTQKCKKGLSVTLFYGKNHNGFVSNVYDKFRE